MTYSRAARLTDALAKFVRGGTVPLYGAAFLLAACQTPATRVEVREVGIPVAVHPIKPADVPKVPAPLGPRPESLSAAADVLLSKVCELEAYALKADPLLRLSAGEPQQPLPAFKECERLSPSRLR